MNVEFLEPARTDLIDAVMYYERQREGLGRDFSQEVRKTIKRIVRYPEAWSLTSDRTRQ